MMSERTRNGGVGDVKTGGGVGLVVLSRAECGGAAEQPVAGPRLLLHQQSSSSSSPSQLVSSSSAPPAGGLAPGEVRGKIVRRLRL